MIGVLSAHGIQDLYFLCSVNPQVLKWKRISRDASGCSSGRKEKRWSRSLVGSEEAAWWGVEVGRGFGEGEVVGFGGVVVTRDLDGMDRHDGVGGG